MLRGWIGCSGNYPVTPYATLSESLQTRPTPLNFAQPSTLPVQHRRARAMTTEELLSLMHLLSAMESAMLTSKIAFPSHISDEVTRHTEIIEREILARSKP